MKSSRAKSAGRLGSGAPNLDHKSSIRRRAWTNRNGNEPPHSVEAEQGVLGSMLISPREAMPACIEKIRVEYFHVPTHRTIFTLLCDLWDAGAEIDLITFTQALRDRNLLESVGGAAFVTHLFTFVPTAANVSYYIDIVRDKHILREIITAATETVRRAYEEQDDVDGAVLNELESRVVSIRSLHGRNGAPEFTVRTGDEILKLKLDTNDCLIADRLLAEGSNLVVAGAAGIGKSRMAEQLAASLITGQSFCGLETHAKGKRILFLQTENSNRRLKRDLKALKRAFGKEFLNCVFFHTLEVDTDGFTSLDDEAAVRRIAAVIQRINPDIIIIDPLRDFGIGDLNSDADMIATVLALGRLCRISNPKRAIIVVHHALTGKAGASKATGWERSGFARNSKALLGWTRAQINVAPALPDDNSQLVIACGKNNDGKEFAPFAIHLNDSTMMYEVLPDFDLDNWRHEITSPGKTGVKPQLLRDLLEPGREYDKKQIVALIKEETGCAKTRAYELVDQAKARSVLRFNKTIKTYVLA